MKELNELSLSSKLIEIEKQVGKFSCYQTVIFNKNCTDAQNIPFNRKPAQQFLTGLGVQENMNMPLSKKANNNPIQQDNNSVVNIYGFDTSENFEKSKLIIPGQRVNRLVKSAKIYVNNEIVPTGLYQQAIKQQKVQVQDKGTVENHPSLYWQNIAVGICHVQEVDLLVQQKIEKEKAITMPRTGKIEEGEPGLLLLSSPALNFAYGTASSLDEETAKKYMYEMFFNLFYATQQEGRQYIVLPAAGLGAFLPNDNKEEVAGWYFEALKQAAQKFPQLNIIYHPAQFHKKFQEVFNQETEVHNVVQATKDVVFIADELTKAGFSCALHNPSDSDVVYGVYDVGEYWKTGKGAGFVGEEYLGTMTTAPLNSFGLNPVAYQTVIEHNRLPIQTAKNNIFSILDHVLEAYKTESKGFDNKSESRDHAKQRVDWSFFLAHNQRGWNDASRRINQLKQKIQNLEKTTNDVPGFNEAVINMIKDSIVANRYSGYKSHSFRHYMHAVVQFKEEQQNGIEGEQKNIIAQTELEQFMQALSLSVESINLDQNAAKQLEQKMRESQNNWKNN